MNRKDFLDSTSKLALGTLVLPHTFQQLVTGPGTAIPVIDTHQHLWDTNRFPQGWSKSPMNLNFDMDAYKRAIGGSSIVNSVYVEVAVPPESRRREALYASEMCSDAANPTKAAVIAGDLASDGFKSYMAEFNNNPYIRGLRYRFRSEEEITNDMVINHVRILGDMGKSFEFSVKPAWLPAMAKLISMCPETTFMVNHCGNVDPRAFLGPGREFLGQPDHMKDEWLKAIEKIASYENTACKISGVITRVKDHTLTAEDLAPAVNQCLDTFGADRVMFASDWPVCLKKIELKGWLDLLQQIVGKRPFGERKKLFHDNALRLYQMKI